MRSLESIRDKAIRGQGKSRQNDLIDCAFRYMPSITPISHLILGMRCDPDLVRLSLISIPEAFPIG